MEKCPYCDKDILENSVVCRHCKRKLSPAEKRSGPIYIGDKVRERWGAMTSEDHEILNSEYLWQIYLMQNRATKAVESIKGWVVFFGVITILGIIFSLFISGC